MMKALCYLQGITMKPITQCVLLLDQASAWAQTYAGAYKQLRVQPLSFESLLQGDTPEQGLRHLATNMLYYDLAIVVVSPSNVAWVRSQLYYARPYLRTPVLALVKDLQPIAIQDVLDVGAVDFIMDYRFISEFSIRVKILQQRLHKRVSRTESAPEETLSLHAEAHEPSSLEAYTAALATRYAVHCQPFQQAKNTVIQRFEKAYIRAILVRNQGNITRAARSAQKHRRSFWELMRKHNIDAEIYRVSACPEQLSIR